MGHEIFAARYKPIFKFGKNEDVDALDGEVLVWSAGTTYPYQTSAQTVEIVSASDTDTTASTGAHTILVQGLDANWDLQEETVSMAGSSPVELANQYIRVYRLALMTAGTLGTNVGNITLRLDGGGSTLLEMPAGDGASFFGGMPIPRGYAGYVYRLKTTTTFAQNSEVIIRVRYRPFGGAFRVVDERSVNRDAPESEDTLIPLSLAPKSDFAVTAEASGSNESVYTAFTIVLVPLSGE